MIKIQMNHIVFYPFKKTKLFKKTCIQLIKKLSNLLIYYLYHYYYSYY